MKVPSRTSRLSTLELSKRIWKETPSRRAMTLGFEEMKGPGGMLVLMTVDWYFLIRSAKNLSRPWW